MLRTFTFLFFVQFLTFYSFNQLSAQVPNGDFENWHMEGELELPDMWETNHETEFKRIIKSNQSASGSYSLQMIPAEGASGLNTRCEATAELGFALPADKASGHNLFFYLKTEPLDGGDKIFFTTKIQFYRGNGRLKLEYIPVEEILTDFTLQEIEIPAYNIDSIHIKFNGAGILRDAGHGCGSLSHIWIDDVHIAGTTAREDIDMYKQHTLFPNPASGQVFLRGNTTDVVKYSVYNAQGQLMESEALKSDFIQLPMQGMNYILLYHVDGTVSSHKVMNN